jgi:hypothetical protein
MKGLPLLSAFLILVASAPRAEGADAPRACNRSLRDVSLGDPTLDRASDRVYAQLQALFRKYFPEAVTANLHRKGMSFEHE